MFRALRNILRLIGIARTLARHDALSTLDLLGLGPWPQRVARFSLRGPRPSVRGLRRGQRLVLALQELGPSFIKFGQTWSTRADLVGEDMARDLGELRDRLPPFPTGQARDTVVEELGRPIDELFATFDDQPVAAASIAQVHYAVTVDGDEVAVKVLRPGIEEAFHRDIRLFMWLAEVVERTQPSMRRLKPVAVVANFARIVDLEMDLRYEAAAASELAENFDGDATFGVPSIDWQRTSRRVLTLERMIGVGLSEPGDLTAAGIDRGVVVTNLLQGFLRQVFRDGFFHADLHPGNLFADADGNVLAVDFGIMGRLDRQSRLYLSDLLLAFLKRDYWRAAEVHFEAGYVPADQSLSAFAQACRSIGEPILGRPAKEISVARLLAQLLQTTETFQMETQPQLLLLQKTMVVAEGVARSLDADVVVWEIARPVIEEWMRDNLGVAGRVRDGATRLGGLARRLPALAEKAESVISEIVDEGFRLHPDTVRALAAARRGPRRWNGAIMVLAAAIALAAIAILVG